MKGTDLLSIDSAQATRLPGRRCCGASILPPIRTSEHQTKTCCWQSKLSRRSHAGDAVGGQALLRRVESAAEAHAAFAQLFDIAELLGDPQRLWGHMEGFPGMPEPGWGQSAAAYVFDRWTAYSGSGLLDMSRLVHYVLPRVRSGAHRARATTGMQRVQGATCLLEAEGRALELRHELPDVPQRFYSPASQEQNCIMTPNSRFCTGSKRRGGHRSCWTCRSCSTGT